MVCLETNMNTELFKSCLSQRPLGIDRLKIVYDFSGTAADKDYVFNSVNAPEEHYISAQINGVTVNGVDSDALPGFPVVGGRDSVLGKFNGSNVIKVGNQFPFDSWFAFLSFDSDRVALSTKSGKGRIIISSKESPSSPSGFLLGINESNRLFLEYNEDYALKVDTFPIELSDSNVIFLSKNDGGFSMGRYDFDRDALSKNSLFCSGFKDTSGFYLGGCRSVETTHLNFSGLMNGFSLFSGVATESDAVPNCFLCSGMSSESSDASLTTHYVTGFKEINVFDSVMIGASKESSSIILGDGEEVTVLRSIPVFETQSSTVSEPLYEVVSYPGENNKTIPAIDEVGKRKYLKNLLTFQYPLSSGDHLEFYSFKQPQLEYGIDKGKYTQTDIDTDAIFSNGLLGVENVDYVSSGVTITRIMDSEYTIDDLQEKIVILEVPTRDWVFLGGANYGSHLNAPLFTGMGPNLIPSSDVNKYDFYLNGQKLVSGVDYLSDVTMDIGQSVIVTGTMFVSDFAREMMTTLPSISQVYPNSYMMFVPKPDEEFESSRLDIEEQTDYLDAPMGYSHLLWLNGVRQKLNEDYFKHYRGSLINASYLFDVTTHSFYNNG